MTEASNVDPREIARFNRLAQLWWDPHGKMGQLHAINPLRTSFVLDRVTTPRPRILDVGCGGGILAESLRRHGARVTGIDLSLMSLDIARRHAADNGLDIDYRYARVEDLAGQEPGTFDAVTCMEMLEHVPDPSSVVQACARLLKPGGHVFFSTINRTPKAFLFAIVAGEYILGLLPRGTHHYRMLVQPDELRVWAATCGLRFIASDSLMYNPLTRRFRVAGNREDVNYMSCFASRELRA
jgi:2-polyprenyl-6-hydroxyphenyl methylase/3-demethylubiquinone-9 3-methyltransferase